MSDMIKEVVELSNGLKVELFREPGREADFPWGERGELIQDMSKILVTNTSRKLYSSARVVTPEGVEIPLFPTKRDYETEREMSLEVSGYMVGIDKEKAQIQKKTVYYDYGYEVSARTMLQLNKKAKDVEVREMEMNSVYRHPRFFENTYVNGQRHGKETEYRLGADSEKIKVRDAEWKNDKRDGEEIFYERGGIYEKRIWKDGVRKQKIQFEYKDGHHTDEVSRLKEYKEDLGNNWVLSVSKFYENNKLETETVQKEDFSPYNPNMVRESWDTHFVVPLEEWEYDQQGNLAAGWIYRERTPQEYSFGSEYIGVALSEKDIRFIRKKLEVQKSLREAEKIASSKGGVLKGVRKAQQKGVNVSVKDVMAFQKYQNSK